MHKPNSLPNQSIDNQAGDNLLENRQTGNPANGWDALKSVPYQGERPPVRFDADDTYYRNIFQDYPDPVSTPEDAAELSAEFSYNKHVTRIINYSLGDSLNDRQAKFNFYQNLSPADIQAFHDKYPMPMDFDAISDELLSEIKRNNPPEKYQEYAGDLANFRHQIYGEREDIWRDVKAYRANNPNQISQSPSETTDDYRIQKLPSVHILNNAEFENVMEYAVNEGDPYTSKDGRRYQLTPEYIKENDLGPAFECQIENSSIFFSKPFKVGSRDAFIGYTPTKEGIKLRSYYRSGSQGLWRLLPDHAKTESGGDWYGKGYSEESLTLPAALQKSLNALKDTEPAQARPDPILGSSFFLLGTGQEYLSKQAYGQAMHTNSLRSSVYREVAHTPLIDYGHISADKHPPESLSIPDSQSPDFREETDSWFMNTDTHGEVRVSCFDSSDKSCKYMFCTNRQGRSWIGSIEANSPVTSSGLRQQWCSGGDFCTPIYEYRSMAGDYGNYSDSKGSYVDMWKNYNSKIPVIRKYHQFLKQKFGNRNRAA